MILWIVSTVLLSAAAVLVSAPFIWRYAVRHSTAAFETKARADGWKSAENGASPGPIDADRIQSAAIEIERPADMTNRTAEPARPRLSTPARIWTAAAASVTIVLGSVGLYALTRDQPLTVDPSTALGSLPPLASRSTTPIGNLQLFPKSPSPADRLLEQLAPAGSRIQSAPTVNPGLPPVDELIERLVARLRQNPKDVEGWRTLGWSYFNLQRFDEAATAYAKAIELNPNIADFYDARGEALVRAANGTVTAESQQAFSDALRLDSKEPRARFFIGLAKVQAGDKVAALDAWIALANDIGTSDPTAPELRQHIAELAKELDVDVNQRLRQPLESAAERTIDQSKDRNIELPAPTTVQRDSKTEDAKAPAAPGDQSAMIRAMVDGLASRLEKSPRDVEGWIRLIRSRQVLNEPEAARQALDHALRVFGEPSPERDHLVTAVKELGLSP